MNKVEHPNQFSVEDGGSHVSPAPDTTGSGPSEAGSLNDYARQIAHQLGGEAYSPALVIGLLRLFEFLLQAILGFFLLVTYSPFPGDTSLEGAVLTSVSYAIVMLLALQTADAYSIPALRARVRLLPRFLTAYVIAFTLCSCGLFVVAGIDKAVLGFCGAWLLAGGILFAILRFLIAFSIRRWARNGIMERRAIIVGGGEPARELIRALEAQPDNDIRICGIFDDRGEGRSPVMVAGYPKLGKVSELVEFARITRLDMLIIALPMSAEERILQLLKKLWVLPVDIRLAAHANRLRFRPRTYSHIGIVPMLDIFNKPIRDWDSVAKRGFDIVIASLALCFLWPVMVATAIAIKATSEGPVFFMQKRHGFNNEVIKVFKFRSMYTNMTDQNAKVVVTKGDPRVTRVGRFIRKTSIDELPQLFNVLKGDLSLVGPRPHAVLAQTKDRPWADIVEGYFARHRVKPGVTGWAQINGWRGEVDTEEKIRLRTAYDLHYIENWSLWFDLKILVLTPIRLLNTENAY